MARVTSCAGCGAPHRPPHGVTRFRCDFCGRQNLASDRPDYEELVSSAPVSRERATSTIRRELAARGLPDHALRIGPERWLPLWQAIARDGEEQVFPADPAGGPLDARLGLPAVPLLSRDDPRATELELPEAAPVDAHAAEQASRSLFVDSDFEPRVLRLVWLRVVDLQVGTETELLHGLHVLGTHQIHLPGGRRGGALTPMRPRVLAHYGAFLLGAMLLLTLVGDPLARAVALAVWATATWLAERHGLPWRRGTRA